MSYLYTYYMPRIPNIATHICLFVVRAVFVPLSSWFPGPLKLHSTGWKERNSHDFPIFPPP